MLIFIGGVPTFSPSLFSCLSPNLAMWKIANPPTSFHRIWKKNKQTHSHNKCFLLSKSLATSTLIILLFSEVLKISKNYFFFPKIFLLWRKFIETSRNFYFSKQVFQLCRVAKCGKKLCGHFATTWQYPSCQLVNLTISTWYQKLWSVDHLVASTFLLFFHIEINRAFFLNL